MEEPLTSNYGITKTYKEYSISTLTEANECYHNIKKNLDDLNNIITPILKEINNVKLILSNIEKYYSSQSPKELKPKIFNQLKEYIEKFYNKNSKINYSMEIIKQKLDLLFDYNFSPENNINSIDDSMNINFAKNYDSQEKKSLFSNFYSSSFSDEENKHTINEEILIKCFKCNLESACYLCENCNMMICKKCEDEIINKTKHKFIYLDFLKTNKEIEKMAFLNSLKIVIKILLKKSNYLLNYEKKKIENVDIYNSNKSSSDNYILKTINIKFPYINPNNKNSLLVFLEDLDSILKNFLKINFENEEEFNVSELNKILLKELKNIFEDKNFNLIKEKIEIIDNNFYSDDDIEEEKSLFNYNKNKFKDLISNEIDKKFNELKNNFYYVINIIPKHSIIFDQPNFQNTIINLFNEYLAIDKLNIFLSFNNKSIFIDTFIRDKNFVEMKPIEIKSYFSDFNALYNIKIIINNLLNEECNIGEEFFDYKGNFFVPNKEFNKIRGSEIYYPPYGWIGIGLKVVGKYDNDSWLYENNELSKWAISYYSFGENLNSDKLKTMINDIITKNNLYDWNKTKNDNSLCEETIGNPGKFICLYPQINTAEKKAGIIEFDKKKYKMILMAKVLTEKINKANQNEDFNYWILDKDYIRIYRILLKEIY